MYGLLIKREVKMARYWPSFFLCIYGPRFTIRYKLQFINLRMENKMVREPNKNH